MKRSHERTIKRVLQKKNKETNLISKGSNKYGARNGISK